MTCFKNDVKILNKKIADQMKCIDKYGKYNEDIVKQMFELYLRSPCKDFFNKIYYEKQRYVKRSKNHNKGAP